MRPRRLRRNQLLALVFAVPVLSGPTTPNDPFHHIAVRVSKPEDPPVCCLRPLAPPEGTDEDVLLSFEEWKAKQMSSVLQEQETSAYPPTGSGQAAAGSGATDAALELNPSVPLPGQGNPPLELAEVYAPDAPYFRIPITDRFNYASTDCSARVHVAQKSAKSPSSILSSKKDKYMLSPCAEKNKFVVVELCDDIRIDTVQLANYEFFSGVFKDFTVSVAKTYTTDTDGWVAAGSYHAKNVRGVQSFHPPTTLSDFYRFIRIDFHSHYGNEYYCPLSLLRVYGLTHLEHWKWDLWESESRNKRTIESSIETLQQPTMPLADWEATSVEALGDRQAAAVAEKTPVSYISGGTDNNTEAAQPGPAFHSLTMNTSTFVPPAEASSASVQTAGSATVTSIIYTPAYTASVADTYTAHNVNIASTASQQSTHSSSDISNDSNTQHTTNSLYNTISFSDPPASHSVSLSLSASSSGSSAISQQSSQQSASSPLSNHSFNVSRSASVPSQSHSLTVVPNTPSSSSGESIYRTIMNRLTALETNTSLYARFVEDHTANVRDMIRKLGEDVGRLEGLGKAQAQTYERSVSHFERQQRRLEFEHSELLQQVSRLTDEVVLEKRLGIAQLCLLLAVLVFMTLTRGSRNEPVRGSTESVRSRAASLRGWGSRTLNMVNRFRSRSVSPPATREDGSISPDDEKLPESTVRSVSSSQGVHASDLFPRSKRVHPITGRKLSIVVRPRTPSTLRAHTRSSTQVNFPVTPTRAAQASAPIMRTGSRPPIERAHSSAMSQSFSMGMMPPGPRSVKHWARTAHLHEVKSAGIRGARNADSTQAHVDAVVAASASPSVTLDLGPRQGIKAEEDIFAPQEQLDATPKREKDERQALGSHAPSPVRLPSRGDLPVACAWATRQSDGDASEGDNWVDTDADESESEAGHLYGHRKGVGGLS